MDFMLSEVFCYVSDIHFMLMPGLKQIHDKRISMDKEFNLDWCYRSGSDSRNYQFIELVSYFFYPFCWESYFCKFKSQIAYIEVIFAHPQTLNDTND